MPIWGIDLGGTKIECAILESRENPRTIARMRVPTESHLGYEHILGQFKLLINLMAAETGLQPDQLGVAHPGTMDPATGTLKNSNTTCMNGMPFDRDLSAILNGLPVKTANDANCFAVAEAHMGAVPDVKPNAEVVFGIIMGTGVGGGVVVNGKVINGRHGIGGEWGHNLLDPHGVKCYCGFIGCVETVISGPALERYYQEQTGQHLKLAEINARAEAKSDPAAEQTLRHLTDSFGKAVATVINIIDPDVIVIGGGVGNIDRLYTDGVEAATKHVFNYRLDTMFVKPKLGDSAGVFGAALL